ncbi:unnamed protein product, partial [Rotaria sp. Silwood2]
QDPTLLSNKCQPASALA